MSDIQGKGMLAEYSEALNRLKAGRPINVPKGTKISNDAVALEAGRGKGSIKKSRPVFAPLIQAINMAARERESGSADKAMKEQLLRAKQNCRQQQQNLDRALASLLSRIYEVHELKAQVRELQGQVELLKGLVPEHLLAKVRALR
jgi:hypothetical protein